MHERHLLHAHSDFFDKYLVKLRMRFLKLANKRDKIFLKVHLGHNVDNTFPDDPALRTAGIGFDRMLIEEQRTVLEDVEEVIDEVTDVLCG